MENEEENLTEGSSFKKENENEEFSESNENTKIFKDNNQNENSSEQQKDNCFIKIVIKLSEDRIEVIEIQKGIDIFMQTNDFCLKNNIDNDLVRPIFNYIQQSLNTLGMIFEKKMDNEILENLKKAKSKYEEIKEMENNYHSDTDILIRNQYHCENSSFDFNGSF